MKENLSSVFRKSNQELDTDLDPEPDSKTPQSSRPPSRIHGGVVGVDGSTSGDPSGVFIGGGGTMEVV